MADLLSNIAGPALPGILGTIDPELQHLVVSMASLVSFAPGDVVIERGAALSALHVVEEGLLRAEVPDRHGLAVEVARFHRGEFCGEMAFLMGDTASATVRAVTAAQVWKVPHAALEVVATESTAFTRELALVLSRRLGQTNRRFGEGLVGRVALVRAESPYAAALMAHVARAVARHLSRPMLVLDLVGANIPGDVSLPPLAALTSDPALMATVAAFGSGLGPAVATIAGAEPVAESALVHVVSEFRRLCGMVVVFADGARAATVAASGDADISVCMASTVGSASLSGMPVIVLAPGEAHIPFAPPRGAASDNSNLIRQLGGNLNVLAGSRPGGATGEPWTAVDWTARHLLGRKIGLALGAGGAKGYAHVGVIQALTDMGVPIDCVAGCSVGAAIAAGYVLGVDSPTSISWLDHTFSRAMRITLPFRSLVSSRSLRNDMEKYFKAQRFEDQARPLRVVAVDLPGRREVVFRRGPMARPIVASMAIPGIFPPVRIAGRTLIDGGVLNPVPIGPAARAGADMVIGVKLSNPPQPPPTESGPRRRLQAPPIVETVQQAFEVMQWRIVADGAAQADITIEPVFTGKTGLRDYVRGQEFFETGYEAAYAARPALSKMLGWLA